MTHLFDSLKLIRLRNEKFWTQEDLAAAAGVSVRTIQRIESGGDGSLESWKALAAAFNIELSTLRIEQPSKNYTKSEKRNAIFGATLGCAGGLLGCSFGWAGLLQKPVGFHGAISDYPVLTAMVTLATAFCLIVPIVTWRRTLR